MSTVNVRSPELTAVDIADRFGPIPLRRLVFDPRPGDATEDDLVELHDRTRGIFELADGILVEKPVGVYESWLAGQIQTRLNLYLRQHDIGFTVGEAGMLRLVEGLVRAPDVSFVAWEKVSPRRVPRQKVPHVSPNLAVEVLSASNTLLEMERKLDDYFATGVELVWYVDPRSRAVRVYAARDAVTTLTDTDVLDGGSVLPGFSVTIAALFAEESR